MVNSNLKLFVREGCKRCKEFENFLKNKKIDFELIDVASLGGFMSAQLNEVMMLPTLMIFDSNGNAINRFNMSSEINEIIAA